MSYSQVLIASHLSESSLNVATKAKEIADKFEANLSIVHALPNIPQFAYGYFSPEELERNIMSEAKKQLALFAEKLQISESSQYLINKPSKIAILEVAKKINADLIIIGSHGKHGFFSTVGSTTQAVINGANCDVFVVRHHES